MQKPGNATRVFSVIAFLFNPIPFVFLIFYFFKLSHSFSNGSMLQYRFNTNLWNKFLSNSVFNENEIESQFICSYQPVTLLFCKFGHCNWRSTMINRVLPRIKIIGVVRNNNIFKSKFIVSFNNYYLWLNNFKSIPNPIVIPININ